jgi:glycosyltransferase involved in cell wall biosynthesis
LTQPLLSVITVSLNAAATIEDTLASVALQRAEFAVEHVCVDGGSTDATRAIIDRWAERNRRIIRLYEPDSGIFDAMNKGLGAARGEYLLFLNADDFLVRQDTLAQALCGLSADPARNPDLLLGDAAMGEPGRLGLWRHRCVPRLIGVARGFGFYPVHQGQFSKRSLLQAVDGFDAKARLGSDVTQFYDLQRRFQPTIRRLATDIALMREQGSANASLHAMRLGTVEIYRHLLPKVGRLKATGMVLVKTLQSLSELRFGRCPHRRWFAE